jgi:beta-glucanase (GH16 family)
MTPSKKPLVQTGWAMVIAGFLAAGPAQGVMVTWVGTNGFSATTNWSDVNNWDQINTTSHISPANNAANFTFQTAMPGPGLVTVNVDGAYGTPGTGPAQSYGAFFGQTNGYHTVFIQPGITWALQAQAGTPGLGLCVSPQPTNNNTIGAVYNPGISYTNYTTIEGVGGTLLADSAGLRVEGGSTIGGNHYSILDMSGLGTFIMTNNQQGTSANINSNSFLLVDGAPNSQGLIYLALTNVITLLDNFQVGYVGYSSNSLPIGVYLGQSNYISTGPSNNNLVIGAAGCTDGFLQFNPALLGGAAKPTVYLTGYGGSQNVTICGANGGVAPGSALCNLTGGIVTWFANTLSLGVSGTSGISANGVLTFDGGTINANSVTVGAQPNSGGAAGAGTINIGQNAVFQANNSLVLGSATGTAAPGTAGTINITGGTLVANSVTTGGGTGTVNLTNGVWDVAVAGHGVTNMIVTAFNAAVSTNIINITSISLNVAPARFHLLTANLSGVSSLDLGSLPVGPDPAHPYKGYLDTTNTPGLIDLVLTGGPFESGPDLLTDPGFEVDPGGPTTTIYGWNIYSAGSGNVLSQTSSTLGNDGNNYLQVFQAYTGATNDNGVYQDNISGPGAVYAANGWAFVSSSGTLALAGQNVAWIEVTFRDAGANILALYRSALINTNAIATGAFPENTWVNLPVTNQYNPLTGLITNSTAALVAPSGTSFVRYQVVFQGDPAGSQGSVFFDDLTLIQTAGGPYGNYNIVWSDEFNGTSISTNNWVFNAYNIGNGQNGWGNNELEYYTATNAYVSNGLLHIMAYNQPYDGYNYTSAKMITDGLVNMLYGRIAFRVSIPPGAGLWPACWLVPQDSVYGPWAASGEIDVMESTGQLPNNVIGTIHYGGPYPDTAQSGGPPYNFIPGTSLYDFNVYVLDWTTNAISWYINGWLYETQTNWWSSSNTNNTELNPHPAPFNEPFYIIMNLAIGGSYGGAVDNSAFPADMQVDYVRLYNVTAPLQLDIASSRGNLVLTWPSNIVCHLESTTNLGAGSGWTNVTGAATPYSLSPRSAAAFYRLASP